MVTIGPQTTENELKRKKYHESIFNDVFVENYQHAIWVFRIIVGYFDFNSTTVIRNAYMVLIWVYNMNFYSSK